MRNVPLPDDSIDEDSDIYVRLRFTSRTWQAIEATVESRGVEAEESHLDACRSVLFWGLGYDQLEDVPDEVREGRASAQDIPENARRIFTTHTQEQLDQLYRM